MPVFVSYIVLLLSALVLAGIGVIIAFLGEKACLSRPCVGQAKFINRGMNKDLNPCNDFYSFVCDNFQQFGSSIIDEIERKQLNRLVEYLSVRASWEENGRVEHMAKTLYQNCINDTQLEIEGLRPLQRIIAKIGGIPFLDPLWDYEKRAEFVLVDNELKHFFSGLNSVFVHTRVIRMKTYPLIHPKNESSDEKKKKMYHAFSIPAHLYNVVPPDPDNYLKYCYNFNKLYSKVILNNKTLTTKDNDEILAAAKFKIKLLKLIHKTKNCSQQPFSFVRQTYDKKLGREYTRNGRDNNYATMQDYIRKKAQPGVIMLPYAVVTPMFDKYIDELNALVTSKSTPNRVLANYMGVEALLQMTPFLPPQFREIQEKYMKSERDKHNSVLNDRELLCAKLVKDAMTTALTAEYLKQNPKPPDGVSVLNSLLFNLLTEVKVILRKIKWPSRRDHAKMLILANSIEIVSPLPSDVIERLQEKSMFEQFYIIMCTNEESTLESYLAVKVVRMIRNAQLLNAKRDSGKDFPLSVFHEDYDIFDTEIYFQEDTNVIVVPMAYLFYPSLDSLWPKYLSFGGLAVWIAHKIIKTVGYNNVQYPELQPEKPISQRWWEKGTVSRYENKRKCALNDYNEYLKPFNVKSNDANCLEDTLYNAAALQAAYLAYKENTRTRFFVEARIPYLTKYTVDQIFFIKYASSFCQYQGHNVKLYVKDRDTSRVSSNFTVLYTLRNFPKFSEVFECGKDENMTKSEPCDMWEPITDQE